MKKVVREEARFEEESLVDSLIYHVLEDGLVLVAQLVFAYSSAV